MCSHIAKDASPLLEQILFILGVNGSPPSSTMSASGPNPTLEIEVNIALQYLKADV